MGLVVAGLFWHTYRRPNTDNSALVFFVLAFPLIVAPISWVLSQKHPDVSQLIRRELVSEAAALGLTLWFNSWVRGEVKTAIQNGALSLLTGALVLSTCRVFFEAVSVRATSPTRKQD